VSTRRECGKWGRTDRGSEGSGNESGEDDHREETHRWSGLQKGRGEILGEPCPSGWVLYAAKALGISHAWEVELGLGTIIIILKPRRQRKWCTIPRHIPGLPSGPPFVSQSSSGMHATFSSGRLHPASFCFPALTVAPQPEVHGGWRSPLDLDWLWDLPGGRLCEPIISLVALPIGRYHRR